MTKMPWARPSKPRIEVSNPSSRGIPCAERWPRLQKQFWFPLDPVCGPSMDLSVESKSSDIKKPCRDRLQDKHDTSQGGRIMATRTDAQRALIGTSRRG